MIKSTQHATVVMAALLLGAWIAPHECANAGEPTRLSDWEGNLQHGGLAREYRVHLPPDYHSEKPHPVTFVLHGGGGLARYHNANCTAGTLGRAADRLGMILVYPQGLGKRWQDGRDFVRRQARKEGDEPPDDVGFLVSLLDELSKTLNLDRKAVFATGISNGGLMSYRLALERPDVFAAVAPVAANLPQELAGKAPVRPVAMVIFNGTEDPLMPYNGGGIKLFGLARKTRGDVLSTDATRAFFSQAYGCQEQNPPERLRDVDPSDGTRVTHTVQAKGREGSSVELYSIEGGGHTWPGGNPYAGEKIIGRVCTDIDASQLMLEFFLAHRRQ